MRAAPHAHAATQTCRACKHEFCFACSADYGPIREHDNSRHAPTCRHWAAATTSEDEEEEEAEEEEAEEEEAAR
jgi:hypothetical protein